MMRSTKRSLFGGAMAAAGLIAPAASGQEFLWDYSTNGAYARDEVDFDPFDNDYFAGPGSFQISASTEFSSADVIAADMGFYIDCDSSAADYVGASYAFYSNFRGDQDWLIIFDWDLTAGQTWDHFLPSMKVDDVTNGVNLLTADKFANPQGHHELYLSAGVDYTVYGGVSAFDAAGSSHFRMEIWIPAPGMLPLLGLAGLATGRRRRRCRDWASAVLL